MLDTVGASEDFKSVHVDIDNVWQVNASLGKLVIIGPTTNENGTPMPVDKIPERMPLWVDWVKDGSIGERLKELQVGNPDRLTVYAIGAATLAEVTRLRELLTQAGCGAQGKWFRAWGPLVYVIEALRGPV